MIPPRILIACVGNVFLGDDAFGVEVASRMAKRSLPEGVSLVDFGIRGFDLALALLDDANDVVILIDAIPRGEPPGTLYVIEPEWSEPSESEPRAMSLADTHALAPSEVLRLVSNLGGRPKPLFLVGCEPTPFDEDDPPMALSPPVQAAVDDAILLVELLVSQVQEGLLANVTEMRTKFLAEGRDPS